MKTCKTCFFFHVGGFDVVCRRFPVSSPTLAESWCGEHKDIPKKPVVKRATPKKSVKKEVKK